MQNKKSKYLSLWIWVKENDEEYCTLTFDEIEKIAGVPIDHSFLSYKNELTEYGYKVEKISMKKHTVLFYRVK